MKILLAHNHYGAYAQGGEATVFNQERDLLRAYGNEVETFEKTKSVVEEYCGIRNLEYSEAGKTIYRGEINEECPETPVLDAAKLDCLTKEELILIAPKLKGLFAAETESAEKE